MQVPQATSSDVVEPDDTHNAGVPCEGYAKGSKDSVELTPTVRAIAEQMLHAYNKLQNAAKKDRMTWQQIVDDINQRYIPGESMVRATLVVTRRFASGKYKLHTQKHPTLLDAYQRWSQDFGGSDDANLEKDVIPDDDDQPRGDEKASGDDRSGKYFREDVDMTQFVPEGVAGDVTGGVAGGIAAVVVCRRCRQVMSPVVRRVAGDVAGVAGVGFHTAEECIAAFGGSLIEGFLENNHFDVGKYMAMFENEPDLGDMLWYPVEVREVYPTNDKVIVRYFEGHLSVDQAKRQMNMYTGDINELVYKIFTMADYMEA
ncbi:hypothetical protein CYMTET_42085 [Cymbomonas tetramitiformis]|uniref:Uncharacterized protein n=1 Tax=Cymbomonas tetramitiformis TaxID=36881 RepID=A0AAE0F1C4_9CHLO|nr:hypothetical protein CYMTET_42085 [Cymbomonas tetramitiformis]